MVQRFSQQDEEKMRRFVKKIFQGLLDMQRGLTKETFVSKETGDRMYTLWAYNQGLILTATGTWGTCTSHHRFSSQDFLKEAASVLKTCLFLVDAPADIGRILQEVLADEAIDDFQLEFTE